MEVPSIVTCFLLLLGVAFTNANVNAAIAQPAYCQTRPVAIPVDAPHHRYIPYFATVHRCSGGCYASPLIYRCTNISSEEVFVKVRDNDAIDKEIKIKVLNHTKCDCRCAQSSSDCNSLQRFVDCRCRCDLEEPPKDQPCKPGFIWDKSMCKCKCNRAPIPCGDPKLKVWSDDSCACTCAPRVVNRCARKNKGLDFEACQCVDVQALKREQSVHPQSRMYITLLVLLGFIIIVLFCVMVHFVRRSRRNNLNITFSSEDPLPDPSPKPVLSRSDSGNISSCSHTSSCDVRESKPPSFSDADPRVRNTSDNGTADHENGNIGINSGICTLERESDL